MILHIYFLIKLAEIKVDSCRSLPLEQTMTFHNAIKLIKSVSNNDKNNYYYNMFLEKASYELPKCYVMIELTFLKELILIKQIHQKSAKFVTIGTF